MILDDTDRQNNIVTLCDIYSPSAAPLFLKHMPVGEEDFSEYFSLVQTIISMRGANIDIAERREIVKTLSPLVKKYNLPNFILTNLAGRKNNDSLNSL